MFPNICSLCIKNIENVNNLNNLQKVLEFNTYNGEDFNCRICSSLFSKLFSDNLETELEKHLKNCKHVFTDFSLNINIPLGIYILTDLEVDDIEMFIGEMKNKLKFNFSQIITKITNSPYSAKSTYKITIEINHCNDIFFKKAKISKNNWKTNLNHIFISKLKQFFDLKIFSENFCDDFNQLFSIKIFSHHQPIYITGFKVIIIKGRYKKYSRHISQTPWLVDSSYKPLTSIQEILSPKFCEYLQSSNKTVNILDVSFSASGREDIDVQMLGSGRPFILAFNDPKYGTLEQDLLVEIEKSINSSTTLLEVSKLYIANEKALKYLHEVGETKRKSYTFVNFLTSSALIFCDTILEDHTLNVFNSTKDLKINQWTPIRVMHRRPLLNRIRTLYECNLEYLFGTTYRLNVTTEAGMYIKEFVHGDFGRTNPNLSTILQCKTDISQLDVVDIKIDWPPSDILINNE
ncbi:hypothetical protein HZS_6161 [Henneguya salminicola]|nr:hypothetical protein HZS_6161 [Henneguya salminicola]